MNLWDKAWLYGQARKDNKIGFNAQRISASSRMNFATEGSQATAVEQMQAFAESIGAAYHPEMGIVRGGVPGVLAPKPAKASKPAADKDPGEASDQIAQAFATFRNSKSFKQAFTTHGRLRKGWRLVRGIPTWAGQY